MSIAERAAASAQVRECDRKLEQYRTLLEARTDAAVVAVWISEVQAERATAAVSLSAVAAQTADSVATADEVRQVVEEIGGLVGLLTVNEPKLRSRFYEEVSFTGVYDPDTKSVEASADIGVRKVRVGGASRAVTTPTFELRWTT